jgi:hypothetical protein
VAETFIGRANDRPPTGALPRPAPPLRPAAETASTGTGHPSANDDGAGKPVVPKQGVLALEPRNPAERAGPGLPAGQDHSTVLPVDAGALSPAGPHDGKAADARAHSDPVAPAVTLPKDAVLRAGRSSARNDPETDAKESGRPDAPSIKGHASRPQAPDKPAERQADAEARKLMLEDGMPERDAPPREQPDLGDLEL